MIKLNIGCGEDYREGYINIDGSEYISRVDKIIKLDEESLLAHFTAGSIDFILANDIIEHLFRWEAVRVLNEFYELLVSGGRVELKLPDTGNIISSVDLSVEQKMIMLFGGQDVSGEGDRMRESRKNNPNFFCHKYGWDRNRATKELTSIGFRNIKITDEYTSIIVQATK